MNSLSVVLEGISAGLPKAAFLPHGYCFLWDPGLIGLHVVSDAVIAASYFSIPVVLLVYYVRRREQGLTLVLVGFAAFILACGTTHLFAIYTLWVPAYWADGEVKAVTALLSVVTATLLWPLLPRVLALPSPARLTAVNRALQQEIERREAVNKELEAFAYSVSHDLRAPIRGMAGFSQILIEDFGPQLPPEAQDHLRAIQAEGQRMGQLIDDMLNLSRISRGEMHHESVNLSALAADVLAALRKAEPERKAECIVAEGLTVSGDARLLRILLDNLLGNAWKFTGRTAAPRIEFGAASGNGRAAYFVRDNGAGFDMVYADKLFGAFQRLHTADEFPGTGIGLAIVHRIASRHGGRAWAEGVKDQGATFYFSL